MPGTANQSREAPRSSEASPGAAGAGPSAVGGGYGARGAAAALGAAVGATGAVGSAGEVLPAAEAPGAGAPAQAALAAPACQGNGQQLPLSGQLPQQQQQAEGEAEASTPPAKRPCLPSPFRKPTAKTFSRQTHDLFLVLDLEATCNRRRDLFPIEIIEVSCCLLEAHTLATRGDFQCYVRPTEHTQLDPFCVDLTGITQQQVDAAPPLPEALSRLHAWLEGLGALAEGASLLPCTWTDWDLKICLETECEWRKLPRPPYLRRWCNLKQVFNRRYRRTGNLRKSVESLGLQWEGRLHSGLDDARNTAALAAKMVRDGCVLTVTDSFRHAPPTYGPKDGGGDGDGDGDGAGSKAPPGGQGAAAAAAEGRWEGVGGGGGGTGASASPAGGAPLSAPGRGAAAGGPAPAGGSGVKMRQAVLTLTAVQAQPGCGGPATHGSPAVPPGGSQGGGDGGEQVCAGGTEDAPWSPSGADPPTHGSQGAGVPGRGVVLGASLEAGAGPALYDAAGKWLGRCKCGVAAHFRTTKKPGANLGRQFYSCGRWSISDRSKQCDFFVWSDAVQLAPSASAVLGAAGSGGKRRAAWT